MLLKVNPASLPLGPFACHDPPRLDLSVEGGWGTPHLSGMAQASHITAPPGHAPQVVSLHRCLGVDLSRVAWLWVALWGVTLSRASLSGIGLCGVRLSGLAHSDFGLSGSQPQTAGGPTLTHTKPNNIVNNE